tara:strand:- start:339 stop:818 length:480 start_codon:yes stop_codon:yes gene_type:complete
MLKRMVLFSSLSLSLLMIVGCSTSAGSGIRESLDTKYVSGKVGQSYKDAISKKATFGSLLLSREASDGDDIMIHVLRMKGVSGPFSQAYLYKVWALKINDEGNLVDWARHEYDNGIKHFALYGLLIFGQKAQKPKDMDYITKNYESMLKTSSGGQISGW